MHFLHLLLGSASLLPCVTAFYPYTPPWDTPLPNLPSSNKIKTPRDPLYMWRPAAPDLCKDCEGSGFSAKIRRKAAPLSSEHPHILNTLEANKVVRKYRRRGIPGPAEDGATYLARTRRSLNRASPVKRDYRYSVVSAVQPTASNSVPVDQDGTDYSYFTTVSFGPNKKPMHMLIDTGSADTWVMSANCTSNACKAHNTLGTADSSTLAITTVPWSVAYGTGSVSGNMANDTMSFAGFSIPVSFGLADKASDDFLSYPIDGILGLGQPKTSDQKVPTVMEILVQQGLIKQNLFGVHLQRNVDKTNDGEVNFGFWNKDRFDGDLVWTTSVSTNGLWEIPLDDAGVGQASSGVKSKTAIVDTGTSMILMPPGDAKALLSLFTGVKQVGENYLLPCATKDKLYFTFSKVSYYIEPADYIGKPSSEDGLCNVNIIGRQAFGPNQWLVGDSFLKNVYTVFDTTGNRVGFGAKKGESDPAVTATATAAANAVISSVAPTSTPTDAASKTIASATAQVTGSATRGDGSAAPLGDTNPGSTRSSSAGLTAQLTWTSTITLLTFWGIVPFLL